ncbi:MAG: hypothetical protein QM765_41515 [Myxococcales bacterium]
MSSSRSEVKARGGKGRKGLEGKNGAAQPTASRPKLRAVRSRRKVPVGDPMTLFIEIQNQAERRPRLGTGRGVRRFNGGEHLWLGSRGATLACQLVLDRLGFVDSTLFKSIKRLKSPEPLAYGEIVALSGDFYEEAEDLYEEKPSPVPWLYEGNDLSDLREVFQGELAWIEKRHPGQSYPENNVRLAWNAKLYLELALRNVDHFGWHNLRRYVAAHTEALALAARAEGKEGPTFDRALYYNGFADHFLTDGFAAGHIRVPRQQIIEWGVRRKLSEKTSGALSKLLHDQDGHVDQMHGAAPHVSGPDEGLPVKNSLGTEWHARCDGQLFLDPGAAKSKGVQIAERAVAESVAELLVAWKTGELRKGVYAATRLVPFPSPKAPKLVEKFPGDASEERVEALFESMQWYLKLRCFGGVKKKHVRELFQALPELMGEFNAFVETDAQDPEVQRRVAKEYIAAFSALG